jgi:hypothetical protein
MIHITTPSEEYEFSNLTEAAAWAEPHELIVSVREAVFKFGRKIFLDRKDEFELAWDARRIAFLESQYWSGCQGIRSQRGCDAYVAEHLNSPRFVSKPKTVSRGFSVQQILDEEKV